MHRSTSTVTGSLLSAAIALACFSVPLRATAQNLPPYAQPSAPSQDETIRGVIVAVDGPYRITVEDDRGYDDTIGLHQGTIIMPRGLTLAVGMSVTIAGRAAGDVFDANEIDTPYDGDDAAASGSYDDINSYDFSGAGGVALSSAALIFIPQGGGPPQPAQPQTAHNTLRGFEHPSPGHTFRRRAPDAGNATPASGAIPALSASAPAGLQRTTPFAYHAPEVRAQSARTLPASAQSAAVPRAPEYRAPAAAAAPAYHAPESRAPEARAAESRPAPARDTQSTAHGH